MSVISKFFGKKSFSVWLIFFFTFSILIFISFTSCKKEKAVDIEEFDIFTTESVSRENTFSIVYFSEDPPALTPLHAFDPDSYAVINLIFDTLVYLDYDGNIRQKLATRWKHINPTTLRLWLRKGVKFQNGEKFDAKAVKYTFDMQLSPKTKSPSSAILGTIKEVKVIDPYTVDLITHFPDGMLLHRLTMFSSIVPPEYVQKKGLDELRRNPVGTGPYKLVKWEKGRYIHLARNKEYWEAGIPKMDNIVFWMIPEERWYNALLKGDVDFVMHMSGKYASKIKKDPETSLMTRLVTSSYWVIMSNKGPLSKLKVRKALNYAVERKNIIKFADYGNGEIMSSLGKKGEFGYNTNLPPIPYDVDSAKQLLKEAGYENGFKIKALVSDVAMRVAKLIRDDFAKIGVTLEIVEVSRPEWSKRIPISKMTKGVVDFDGDMTINLVDNPLINLAFHSFIFLHSKGPFSLQSDAEYDKKLMWAISTSNLNEHKKRLQELDKYIYDNYLIIPTYQRILTVAMRKNVGLEKINLNGHLSFDMLVRTKKK